jgi:hypothetical protein
MTETIQQLKENIAILQMKLQKLEETNSPVEEAFKRVFRHYPNEKDFREGIWFGFEKGYNASQKPEKEQQVKELVKESVKWCEEHPDKDPLDWLKPQTPMKTKAQEVLYAYMDVERDLSQPKILIHTLKELINQLQVSPGIIKCPDIIELCEELKKL